MLQLDKKIASIVYDSLTLEELEVMVEHKKRERNKLSAPIKMSEEDKIKNYCMGFLKKKLNPPKYK